jgi:hypothetical protein
LRTHYHRNEGGNKGWNRNILWKAASYINGS